MPYTFSVVAWEDWNKHRYGGVPPTPQEAKGVKVLVTGVGRSEGDDHQFWTFNTSPKNAFQDFSEWWVLIGSAMVGHGMDLADEPEPPDYNEPPPDDDYDDEEDEDEEDEPDERPSIVQRISNALGRFFRRR